MNSPKVTNQAHAARENDALLRTFFDQLRTEEMSPATGFYGRVVDRIREKRESIWFPLIASRAGARLLALSLILLAAAILQLAVLGARMSPMTHRDRDRAAAVFSPDPGEQRDAVLAQLSAY